MNEKVIESVNGLRLASSQPLLQQGPIIEQRPIKESGKAISGTMYRQDILYQGSLDNIPQYRSQGELSKTTDHDRYGSFRRTTTFNNEMVSFDLLRCRI